MFDGTVCNPTIEQFDRPDAFCEGTMTEMFSTTTITKPINEASRQERAIIFAARFAIAIVSMTAYFGAIFAASDEAADNPPVPDIELDAYLTHVAHDLIKDN